MCGVAGIVSLDTPQPARVRRMCDVLAHRGPDGAGFHDGPMACLGMRRLAVVDIAGGAQPVYSEDRTVVGVFNGELYNYQELRRDLLRKGHRVDGEGDSACLPHLYEEYGDELVHRLRGMFAFAIWDAERGRLLLARDRLGKKPLYWRADGASVEFASELKALVQEPERRPHLDPVALHHYLTYQYVPAPWSIYQGISKLPAGGLLVWDRGRVSERRYWKADFSPRPVASEEEECARLRELLLESTRLRLVSDRPVGAFLSGGVDSSAVVAAMSKVGCGQLRTYCVGFEDQRFDERAYAREVASRYGTEHHELVVTPDLLDVLPTLAWHFDEPFADSSAIPSFYVAQLCREQVTVVLNGDGGDECFGGYRRYAVLAGTSRIRMPQPVHTSLERLGTSLLDRAGEPGGLYRAGRALRFLGTCGSKHRYARLMSYFEPHEKARLYTDALRRELAGIESEQLLYDVFDESRADADAGRAMDADMNLYLPGDLLAKVDITTMANSVEARSPFLDHHLVEWAAGLPTRLKTRPGVTKYLLKRAVANWLPRQVLDRPKAGFGVPLAHWLRTCLRPVAWDLLTDETARSRDLFEPEAVAWMLERHDAGEDHATRIWALIQFELWHRTFLDTPCMPLQAAATACRGSGSP
ncbi:MAG TPA: asparagine synthase (glutamine-hydrolyzing) [Actinocrinis sp.]|nr:asparagine synthase (glutamine-hydrolyzing) [Actinocrinis sp.]